MRRLLLPALVLCSLALAGCGDDEPDPAKGTPSVGSPATSDVPDSSATSEPAVPAESSEPAEPSEPEPSEPEASADDVIAEVTEVAPELESFYRGGPYPQSVDDAVASLDAAGVTLLPGHQVGGYVFDAGATEFVLCLEDDNGAWASYDTAPMGVRDSGTSGGCPAS